MGNTQLESVEYELVWALVKNPHWFRHALNVCLAIVSPFVGLACAFISTWGCTHTHTHGYIKHRESQITQRYIFSFNPDQLHASCQVCSPSAHKISRQHTTMQASTLLRKPAHYYAIQHTTTQDSTLLRDPAHYNARQHTTTQDSTLQRKPALYYARQHSTTRARPCCVLYFLCLGNAKSKALKHSPCFGSCTFLCLKHHNHL